MDALAIGGMATLRPAQVLINAKAIVRRTRHRFSMATLTTVVVGLGILVRLMAWRFDRSLWLDEIYLALNITGRSFPQLWQPLSHDQGAPVGFLMLVKLATTFFGTSEMALRLVPLITGVGAMMLFPRVARRLLPVHGVVFATALFAFTPKLVYYSSELKQYSSDVFVTLCLFALAMAALQSGRYVLLTIGGAIAIWFSHPAAFLLAGLGLVLFAVAFWRSDATAIRGLLYAGMAWTLSFAACYLLSLRHLSGNRYLLNYWNEYFAPLPPKNFADFGWYVRAVTGVFEGPAGMSVADVSVAVPALLLFGFGWHWLWRRVPFAAACVVGPLAVAMVAAMAHRYPFGGRLLLFAVPLLHLCLGAAFSAAWCMYPSSARNFMLVTCGVVLLAPAMMTLQQTLQPRAPEDNRTVMRYVGQHLQPGDGVLLSGMAREPWEYYGSKFGIDADILGQVQRDDWDSVREVVEAATGRQRVWVFVAHERDDNRKLFLWQLNQIGRCSAKKVANGASVYLYDLSATGDFTDSIDQ